MNSVRRFPSRIFRRVDQRLPWTLYALIALNVVIELVLVASDLRLLPPRLRSQAYEYGAFWAGLLTNWRPNYPAQPATMFVSYAFLHGGIGHLAVNMITLLSLGSGVIRRAGQVRFGLLYAVSLLGGAVGFGLLASTPQPMVGASGALFGLAGALIGWSFRDARAGERWRTLLLPIALLAAMNVALWWALSGSLAWQAHLGGFVAGFACAFVPSRVRRR